MIVGIFFTIKMLQRVQTIYLVLAFICAVLLLFFPIFHLSVVDPDGVNMASSEVGAYGLNGDATKLFPLYIVFIAEAMLALTAIFLYKNRRKQLLVCRLNLIFQFLVAISFLLAYFFGFDFIASQYADLGHVSENVEMKIGLGYYLLFIGIPLLLLAIRGIRADEALLKSLDRLR